MLYPLFCFLGAMQSVMQEEMRREMLRTQYEQGRKDVINSALSKYDLNAKLTAKAVLLILILGTWSLINSWNKC